MQSQHSRAFTNQNVQEIGDSNPFAAAMSATHMPMIITDPRQRDNPIAFANDAFLSLSGYGRDEILGRNCRFLQGPDTDPDAVEKIRQAVRHHQHINIDVLNYRKDGSTFWNSLYITPVSSSTGEIIYHFASQLDVTERYDALQIRTALLHEVDHRVKNNLQMIAALMMMQTNGITDKKVYETLSNMIKQIHALCTVHRRLYQSDDVTRFAVHEFASDIVHELVTGMGRTDIAVQLDLEPVDVSAEQAAPLGLIVNELVTNVVKHAFSAGQCGRLRFAVRQTDKRFRIEIEDDGVGMGAQVSATVPTFGKTLVRMLARQLRSAVTWSAADPSGTRVVLDVPLA